MLQFTVHRIVLKIVISDVDEDRQVRVDVGFDPRDLCKVLFISPHFIFILFALVTDSAPRPQIHTHVAIDIWLWRKRHRRRLIILANTLCFILPLLDVETAELVLLDNILDLTKLVELDVEYIGDVL